MWKKIKNGLSTSTVYDPSEHDAGVNLLTEMAQLHTRFVAEQHVSSRRPEFYKALIAVDWRFIEADSSIREICIDVLISVAAPPEGHGRLPPLL